MSVCFCVSIGIYVCVCTSMCAFLCVSMRDSVCFYTCVSVKCVCVCVISIFLGVCARVRGYLSVLM